VSGADLLEGVRGEAVVFPRLDDERVVVFSGFEGRPAVEEVVLETDELVVGARVDGSVDGPASRSTTLC